MIHKLAIGLKELKAINISNSADNKLNFIMLFMTRAQYIHVSRQFGICTNDQVVELNNTISICSLITKEDSNLDQLLHLFSRLSDSRECPPVEIYKEDSVFKNVIHLSKICKKGLDSQINQSSSQTSNSSLLSLKNEGRKMQNYDFTDWNNFTKRPRRKCAFSVAMDGTQILHRRRTANKLSTSNQTGILKSASVVDMRTVADFMWHGKIKTREKKFDPSHTFVIDDVNEESELNESDIEQNKKFVDLPE